MTNPTTKTPLRERLLAYADKHPATWAADEARALLREAAAALSPPVLEGMDAVAWLIEYSDGGRIAVFEQPAPSMFEACKATITPLYASPVAAQPEGGDAVVARIIHSPDAVSRMELTNEGLALGYGTHNVYTRPVAAQQAVTDELRERMQHVRDEFSRRVSNLSVGYTTKAQAATASAYSDCVAAIDYALAQPPEAATDEMVDPHHTESVRWRWDNGRLYQRVVGQSKWVECKKVHATPQRIRALAVALAQPPEAATQEGES